MNHVDNPKATPYLMSKRHPEWAVWHSMKQRCTNANRDDYKYYGGRGITFESKWTTFAGFIDDMGVRPTPKHTLERLDGSKGYSKINCVWATRKQQSRNQSNNRFVQLNGGDTLLVQAAEDIGIGYNTAYSRVSRSGSVVKKEAGSIMWEGKLWRLCDLSRRYGISSNNITRRQALGWSLEKALTTPRYATRAGNTNRKKKCG